MSEQEPSPAEQPAPPPAESKEEPTQKTEAKEAPPQKRPPYTGHKLYEHTQIETGKNLRQPRQKAILFKEISLGLFGRRRFKRIDLTCTLNNFYSTLSLASIFHRRVAGLYLIVQLEKVHFTEFVDDKDTQGKSGDHSIFRLTLTKQPTEKDRNSVGFNEARKIEQISDPITGLPERRQRRKNQNRKNDKKGKHQDKEREHEPRERKEPRERREKDERKPRQNNDRERRRENEKPTKDSGQNKVRQQQRPRGQYDQYKETSYKKQYEAKNYQGSYRQDRKERQNESRHEYRRDQYQYRDGENQRSYNDKTYRDKREESRYYQKKQEEANYKRGETKTRGTGTGKVAGHSYQQGHIRPENKTDNRGPQKVEYKGDYKTEQKREPKGQYRGDRAPRRNRYSDDEDW